MHPDPKFRQRDDAALIDFALGIGFAHIFVGTPAGPMVVHAPLSPVGDGIGFHLSNGNRAAKYVADATILVSVTGVQGYITPNWYERPADQVPTWNYQAVEIDGVARRLDDAGLRAQLDSLADAHEPRPHPWTLAKTDPAAAAAMMRAITAYRIEVKAMRGTFKLSQNKTAGDRAGVIAGLRGVGNAALADVMEAL